MQGNETVGIEAFDGEERDEERYSEEEGGEAYTEKKVEENEEIK